MTTGLARDNGMALKAACRAAYLFCTLYDGADCNRVWDDILLGLTLHEFFAYFVYKILLLL